MDHTLENMEMRLAELEAENQRLRDFIQIIDRISRQRDIDTLMPAIMTEISNFLDADRSSVFLVDRDTSTLWAKYAENLGVKKIRISLRAGLAGLCLVTGRPVNISSAYENLVFNPEVDTETGFQTNSVLAAPVTDASGRPAAVIQLLNKRTGKFTLGDQEKLCRCIRSLLEPLDLAPVYFQGLEKAVRELRDELDCERASFYEFEKNTGELVSRYTDGIQNRRIRLNLNLGVAGVVAVTGQGLNIKNAYADPRFNRSHDKKTGYHTRSILCVPIKEKGGEVLGVIQVINKKGGPFSDKDHQTLEKLSAGLAISVENAILFDEQHRQFRSILKVMAASIDAKDSLTAGHSENVHKYAVGVAKEMGFSRDEVEVLSVAALLHDYGKLGIEDRVLKKSGSLTPSEYSHIKMHVKLTRDILDKMYFSRKLKHVPLIAAAHHERLDGSGYNEGRCAEEIPFMSKILAVADVFEALTADRHYRKAMSPEAALALIEKDVGSKYDIHIVEALKRFVNGQRPDAS